MAIFYLDTIAQLELRLACSRALIVVRLSGAAMRTGVNEDISGRRYFGRISNIGRDLVADLVESQGNAER